MRYKLFTGENMIVPPGTFCEGTRNYPIKLNALLCTGWCMQIAWLLAYRARYDMLREEGWAQTRDHFNKLHAPFVQYQNILIFTLRPIQNVPLLCRIQIDPSRSLLNRMNILYILTSVTSQGYGHVWGFISRLGKHPAIYVCKTCTSWIEECDIASFR
jgi:hypothetical protein